MPEWEDRHLADLLKTEAGRLLQQHLFIMLQQATGDSHDCNQPCGKMVMGEEEINVTAEQRREAGVHAHGRVTALEHVFDVLLGGVP